MSKYPCLVKTQFCKTPISLDLDAEGITEDGAPNSTVHWEGYCNYQATSKRVYFDKEVFDTVTAVCLMPGDIAPGIPEIISGTAVVLSAKRNIVTGKKARNPDGTVNYTEVDLE